MIDEPDGAGVLDLLRAPASDPDIAHPAEAARQRQGEIIGISEIQTPIQADVPNVEIPIVRHPTPFIHPSAGRLPAQNNRIRLGRI